jgi:hypothetical protein
VGTKVKTVLFLTALLVFTGLGTSWWNDSWEYRKSVNITEESGSDLSNYQAKISINTSALVSEDKIQDDCSDLRFANSTDTELDFWIESGCNTQTTEVWVKIPELPANSEKEIFAYYGNSEASDGEAEIGTQSMPAYSCRSIYNQGDSSGDGDYWIDPDGGSTKNAFKTYCEMSSEKWTLVGRVDGNDDLFSPIGGVWHNSDLVNQDTSDDISASVNMKNRGWLDLPAKSIRVCYSGYNSDCAPFTPDSSMVNTRLNKDYATLQDLFSADRYIPVEEGYDPTELANSNHFDRAEDFSGYSHNWCGLQYADESHDSCQMIDPNSVSNDEPTGGVVRIGCIGDNSAKCSSTVGTTGGPDDYALGIGATSCRDGYGCDNVGHSEATHYRDNGASSYGTYATTPFIYVKEPSSEMFSDTKTSSSTRETESFSICDKRGPAKECIVNSENKLSSEKHSINNELQTEPTSVLEALTAPGKITVSNSSFISGIWTGSFNITANEITITSGAEFRPENGRILLGEN